MFFMTPETPYPARVRALRVRLLAQNIHVLRGLGGSRFQTNDDPI